MKTLLSKIWSDDFSKVFLTKFFDKEVKRSNHQITLSSLSEMRKIYLGFERSDFDSRMLKSISKASDAYFGKLLTYYLFALDWLSSEDAPQVRKDLRNKLGRLVDPKKSLFENERKCFLHRLNVHLTTFMFDFLEDRHLIQLLHFRDHNFENIVALLTNCVCEFRGMVYLNSKIEKDVRLLRFLLNFQYKFGSEVDMHVTILFVTCVLRKEYQFMHQMLAGFRQNYASINNSTLLMEFYDCYSEFKAISRMLRKVYSDFEEYIQTTHVGRVPLMEVDTEQESDLEKTLFALRKSSRENFIGTRVSNERSTNQPRHPRRRFVHAVHRRRPGRAQGSQTGVHGYFQRTQRVASEGPQVSEFLLEFGR